MQNSEIVTGTVREVATLSRRHGSAHGWQKEAHRQVVQVVVGRPRQQVAILTSTDIARTGSV